MGCTGKAVRCCLPYKGTNISANHNDCVKDRAWLEDVVYPTKVRIFQQITTHNQQVNNGKTMLFTLQRYEFFSKSQHEFINNSQNTRCCLPYKGTNFSANHNLMNSIYYKIHDVVYPTKVRIFQQITTSIKRSDVEQVMLFTLQRYEFFSKSQHNSVGLTGRDGCCLPYKGTNFSANHNMSSLISHVM